jgi:hypothetical protein
MQFHEHPHEHPHHHEHEHVLDRRSALRLGGLGLGGLLLAACAPSKSAISSTSTEVAASSTTAAADVASTIASSTTGVTDSSTASSAVSALTTLPGFDEFASTVNVFASGDYWQIESNGLPAHNMMVGITSWQQQVPLPMTYKGSNAWQLPRKPALADNPVSAKTSLYRGAIALAVNGVPIFNALNNRGEDAFLFGELDKWGGHCGRADDYHYHVAPLHLATIVGSAKPIAYALDGFAIYGSTEPDGSTMKKLDAYNGHVGTDGVYHYHGTTTYPYINGGMRGVIRGVVGDQVDPQPSAKPIREAGAPLQGATITNFSSPKTGQYALEYSQSGKTGLVEYVVSDSAVAFTFTSPTGAVTTEKYTR